MFVTHAEMQLFFFFFFHVLMSNVAFMYIVLSMAVLVDFCSAYPIALQS